MKKYQKLLGIPLVLLGIARLDGAHPTNDLNVYAEPRAGELPLSVQFNNRSKGDYDRWEWDFGDGSTSIDSSPVHVYTESGDYTVKLAGFNGDTGKTMEYRNIINAKFMNPCAFAWDLKPEKMNLVNYVPDSIPGYIHWVELPASRDSTTSGSAWFIYDGPGGAMDCEIFGKPDTMGAALLIMEINSTPVCTCRVPQTNYSDYFWECGIQRVEFSVGDTVRITGKTYGASAAGFHMLRIVSLADCVISGWYIDLPTAVTVTVGEQLKKTPFIWGCGAPCRLSYYIEEGPDSMKISMQTGTITWTPTINDTGIDTVVIQHLPTALKGVNTMVVTVDGPDAITDGWLPVSSAKWYESDNDIFFDIYGKRIVKPQARGIYIQVDENGTVRKRVW